MSQFCFSLRWHFHSHRGSSNSKRHSSRHNMADGLVSPHVPMKVGRKAGRSEQSTMLCSCFWSGGPRLVQSPTGGVAGCDKARKIGVAAAHLPFWGWECTPHAEWLPTPGRPTKSSSSPIPPHGLIFGNGSWTNFFMQHVAKKICPSMCNSTGLASWHKCKTLRSPLLSGTWAVDRKRDKNSHTDCAESGSKRLAWLTFENLYQKPKIMYYLRLWGLHWTKFQLPFAPPNTVVGLGSPAGMSSLDFWKQLLLRRWAIGWKFPRVVWHFLQHFPHDRANCCTVSGKEAIYHLITKMIFHKTLFLSPVLTDT